MIKRKKQKEREKGCARKKGFVWQKKIEKMRGRRREMTEFEQKLNNLPF